MLETEKLYKVSFKLFANDTQQVDDLLGEGRQPDPHHPKLFRFTEYVSAWAIKAVKEMVEEYWAEGYARCVIEVTDINLLGDVLTECPEPAGASIDIPTAK